MGNRHLRAEITLQIDGRARRYRFGSVDQSNLPTLVELWIPGEFQSEGEWVEEPKITIRRLIQKALTAPSQQEEIANRTFSTRTLPLNPKTNSGNDTPQTSETHERKLQSSSPLEKNGPIALRWQRKILQYLNNTRRNVHINKGAGIN